MRCRPALAFLLCFALTATSSVAGESLSAAPSDSSGSWSVTLDGDVRWQQPTPAGTLVLGTSSGVVGLDGTSGKVLWRIDDLRKPKDIELEVLPRPPYALLRLDKGIRGDIVRILIDVTTGREVWNSSAFGLGEIYHDIYVPPLDAMLVTGKTPHGPAGATVDLATGRVQSFAVPSRGAKEMLSHPLIFDTDSSVAITDDAQVTRYLMATGAVAWASPKLKAGKELSCGGTPPAPTNSGTGGQTKPERTDKRPPPWPAAMLMSNDGQRVLTLDDGALHAVDARDGNLVWRKPPKLCGCCVQLAEVKEGILARTMPDLSGNDVIYLLDAGSGEVRWQYPRGSLGEDFKAALGFGVRLTNPVIRGDVIYMIAGPDLVRIALASGEVVKLGKTRIDEPASDLQLESTESGFLVIGTQAMEWLDEQGQSVRHVHYEPPGEMGEGLALLGLAAIADASSHNRRTLMKSGSVSVYVKPNYRVGAERLSKEYHATSILDSLVFMLGNLDEAGFKGPTLVGIHKGTGQTLTRIAVSKEPRYAIDPARAQVFVLRGRTVTARGL